MILYKKTFENIKTLHTKFPIEDAYYAKDTLAVVADGITRDPIGIPDLSKASFEEQLKRYPRPSGGEIAAKIVCSTFAENTFYKTLKEKMVLANQKIKECNQRYNPFCDYLENDYYGTVCACAEIIDQTLFYSYICDCGVIVYDKQGKVKFQTTDEKENISDPYIRKIGIPWNLPEARKMVRKEYRNNPYQIRNGKCVSYGTLTGEESAELFIREGDISLEDGDLIVVYSDGFTNFLHEEDFKKILLHFHEKDFLSYIKHKEKESYEKYGKEKTLVLMKNL